MFFNSSLPPVLTMFLLKVLTLSSIALQMLMALPLWSCPTSGSGISLMNSYTRYVITKLGHFGVALPLLVVYIFHFFPGCDFHNKGTIAG